MEWFPRSVYAGEQQEGELSGAMQGNAVDNELDCQDDCVSLRSSLHFHFADMHAVTSLT
jgi:hypothetical protein